MLRGKHPMRVLIDDVEVEGLPVWTPKEFFEFLECLKRKGDKAMCGSYTKSAPKPTAPTQLTAVVGDQSFLVSAKGGRITITDADGDTVVRVGVQDEDIYVRVNPDITTPRQTFTLENL